MSRQLHIKHSQMSLKDIKEKSMQDLVLSVGIDSRSGGSKKSANSFRKGSKKSRATPGADLHEFKNSEEFHSLRAHPTSSNYLPQDMESGKTFGKVCFLLNELFGQEDSKGNLGVPTFLYFKGSSVTGMKFSAYKQKSLQYKGRFGSGSDYDMGLVWPGGQRMMDGLVVCASAKACAATDAGVVFGDKAKRIASQFVRPSTLNDNKARGSVGVGGAAVSGDNYSALHQKEGAFFPTGDDHDLVCLLLQHAGGLGTHDVNFIMNGSLASALDRIDPGLVESSAIAQVKALNSKAYKNCDAQQRERSESPHVEKILDSASFKMSVQLQRIATKLKSQSGSSGNSEELLKKALANICLIHWSDVKKIADAFSSSCSAEAKNLEAAVGGMRLLQFENGWGYCTEGCSHCELNCSARIAKPKSVVLGCSNAMVFVSGKEQVSANANSLFSSLDVGNHVTDRVVKRMENTTDKMVELSLEKKRTGLKS